MFGVSFAALVRVDDDELTSFSTSVASTPASFSIAAMCALISVRTVCSHLASADPAPLVEAQQHETHLEVAHDRLVNLARERRVVLRQRPVAIPDLIQDLLPCAPPNPTTSASRAGAREETDAQPPSPRKWWPSWNGTWIVSVSASVALAVVVSSAERPL